MNLQRTLQQYANCTASGVVGGSKAQMMYFVEDAKKDIATLSSALAAKDAENERLRLALKEAREMVAHWGAYASEYFQDKHDLPGDLGELDAALAGGSDAS